MGAILEKDDENWREMEESLEFAVLEAVRLDERAVCASLCMRNSFQRMKSTVGEGTLWCCQ